MKTYRRLSLEERVQIYTLYHQGKSIRQIGEALKRSPSTVSRELTRNKYPASYDVYHGYRPTTAQDMSGARASSRRKGHCKLAVNAPLRAIVLEKLQLRWSPEQISEYLANNYKEDPRMQISHESIYTYIYVLGRGTLKKELYRYLRQQKVIRNYRKRDREKKKIPDMLSIEERPASVADRTIPGHWEGDLIIGKDHKSAIGTIVERSTRFLLLVPLKSRDAETVRKAFARALKQLPEQVRLSMTYDQGSEMSQHKLFTKDTKMKVYFAHPHSPWERGTNENTNMLIRDFFPKGTDFNKVSRYKIKKVQHMLNGRPRKTLQWKMPADVFNEVLQNCAK